jgi:hypothetical protein
VISKRQRIEVRIRIAIVAAGVGGIGDVRIRREEKITIGRVDAAIEVDDADAGAVDPLFAGELVA